MSELALNSSGTILLSPPAGNAVLIDATIVRAVLLPAAMKLLGDRNWYLPRHLQWLPKVRLEHEPKPQPARA